MVKRPSKTSVRSRADRDQLAVVLESMQADFRGFGESLQSFREHVDARFEQVDARFQQVDARFQQVDARFDGIERDIALLKVASLETARELRSLRTAVERKVDRDEVQGIVEGVLRTLR